MAHNRFSSNPDDLKLEIKWPPEKDKVHEAYVDGWNDAIHNVIVSLFLSFSNEQVSNLDDILDKIRKIKCPKT
jgi:hypothetical protein